MVWLVFPLVSLCLIRTSPHKSGFLVSHEASNEGADSVLIDFPDVLSSARASERLLEPYTADRSRFDFCSDTAPCDSSL